MKSFEGGTQPGCQGLHHARSTCITRASPASRCITCIRPASPASTLHHLHQPCITCINPASRAKGCINPASAAHGLHHAHQGTRKTQAPSTKHASNAKPPLGPLPAAPHRNRTPRAPRPSRRARRASARPLVVCALPAGARVERRSGARAERRTGRETRQDDEEERTAAARDVPAELRWVSRQGGYYDPDFEPRLSSLRSSRRSQVYIS